MIMLWHGALYMAAPVLLLIWSLNSRPAVRVAVGLVATALVVYLIRLSL